MTEHQFFGKDAPLFAPNACAVSQQLPLHLYKSSFKVHVTRSSLLKRDGIQHSQHWFQTPNQTNIY
jgi:hypothetical protein